MLPGIKFTRQFLYIFLYVIFLSAGVGMSEDNMPADVNFTGFFEALKDKDDVNSVRIGRDIFSYLEKKYRSDAGFVSLKSKLSAAQFLSDKMVSQLKNAAKRDILAIAKESFNTGGKSSFTNPLIVAPAKEFYETSAGIFSKPVKIDNLNDQEKEFLGKFYDLKLRLLTNEVAMAGQALAIAEPKFKDTHNYVLVLPLLHASEQKPVDVNILPKWMRKSEQLDIFSDACLLHYGFSFHAQVFARQSAELQKREFSEQDFYKAAAGKCKESSPHVAVDCLQRAIRLIAEDEIDERIKLKFAIVQIWLGSENFALAAGEAKKIVDSFAEHKSYDQAVWLYYYALSRTNNTNAILTNIDSVIDDPGCSAYKTRLMYMKWWALRKRPDRAADIAAVEHRLLKEFGDNPIIAPILLSRASDLLASQHYVEANISLEQLREKFPGTEAAQQAEKIVQKLKNVGGSK